MTALAAALAALLAAAAPFRAEQPRVREGNERLLSGDAAGALERYDQAEREAGPHPEIDFDRGNALQALGRHAEAREAWRRALEADQSGALSSRALQNMGTALEAEGDREGALKATAEALRRDPANEDARYNLEVLLRRKAQGQGKPQEEGQDGARKEQPAPERGPGREPQEQPADQQARRPQDQPDGARPEPGPDERRREGEDGQREAGRAEERARDGERRAGEAEARAGAIGRQEAERLLDAMRDRERQLPLAPADRKDARRREVERDW